MSVSEDRRVPPSAVFKVLGPNDSAAGSGFLVSGDGLAITCAHVAKRAGGDASETDQTILITFVNHTSKLRVRIIPEYWSPSLDICVLKLLDPIPNGVVPLTLTKDQGTAGAKFTSFGFPSQRPNGLWAYGEIGNLVPNETTTRIQLTGTHEISEGFSGAPLMLRELHDNKELVIGIVDCFLDPNESMRGITTAFAVPATVLQQIVPIIILTELPSTYEPVQLQTQSKIAKILNNFSDISPPTSEVFSNSLSSQADAPPTSLEILAKRSTSVLGISRVLSDCYCVNIFGTAGTGKTSLASLVYQASPVPVKRWLSLHGERTAQSEEQIVKHALEQLSMWISDPQKRSNASAPKEIIAQVFSATKNGLIVIDDYPDLLRCPSVGDLIGNIIKYALINKCQILMTSQRKFSESLKLSRGISVTDVEMPLMDKSDIKEILLAHHASDSIVADNLLTLFMTVTKGHPFYVMALVSYLKQSRWKVRESTLLAIFSGEPLQSIKDEMHRKIFRALGNDKEQHLFNLLCRLSLSFYAFNKTMVQAIASVEPKIASAIGLLNELVGPWIRTVRVGDEQSYEVSPLVGQLGREHLDEKEQRLVHFKFAMYFWKKRRLTPQEANHFYMHLIGSKEWHRLCLALLSLVMELNREPEQSADRVAWFDWIAALFPVGSLPVDMDEQCRILFRSIQLSLDGFRGKENQGLLEELAVFVEQANLRDERVVIACTLGLMLLGTAKQISNPSAAVRLALRAKTIAEAVSPEIRADVQIPDFSSLLWIIAVSIKSSKDLSNYIESFTTMSNSEVTSAFRSVEPNEAPVFLAELAMTLEMEKQPADRDWAGAIRVLDKMEQLSERPGAQALRKPVIRRKALILAEHLGSPLKALEIIEQNCSKHFEDCSLFHTAALISLGQKNPEDSLSYIERALRCEHLDDDPDLVSVLKTAVTAAGRAQNWNSEVIFLTQLIKQIKKQSFTDEVKVCEYIRVLGEYAWLYWSTEERRKAILKLYGMLKLVQKYKHVNDGIFKELLRKTAHLIVYMAQFDRKTGEAAPHPVWPGWMFEHNEKLQGLVQLPLAVPFMALANLASANGCSKIAEMGYKASIDEAGLDDSQGARMLAGIGLANLASERCDFISSLRWVAFSLSQKSDDNADGKSLKLNLRLSMMHGVIIPALLEVLATNGYSTGAIMAKLNELEVLLNSQILAKEDRSFVLDKFREIRLAFSPLAHYRAIEMYIASASADDRYMMPILLVAAAGLPDVPLPVMCACHAKALAIVMQDDVLKKQYGPFLCMFICIFWSRAMQTQPVNPSLDRAVALICIALRSLRPRIEREIISYLLDYLRKCAAPENE